MKKIFFLILLGMLIPFGNASAKDETYRVPAGVKIAKATHLKPSSWIRPPEKPKHIPKTTKIPSASDYQNWKRAELATHAKQLELIRDDLAGEGQDQEVVEALDHEIAKIHTLVNKKSPKA